MPTRIALKVGQDRFALTAQSEYVFCGFDDQMGYTFPSVRACNLANIHPIRAVLSRRHENGGDSTYFVC